MKKLSYEEVINEIESKRRFGNLSGREITECMLDRLSSPQQGLNWIHIAGTNGKGSVSAFLCSILQEAGLKVGMFTSPHLVDFRERIRINGEMISREDAGRLGSKLLAQDFGVHPTMFDYCLVMAVLYFKEKNCDAAIMETGLGGRLDSTNALGIPAVSVITKIGYDHMAVLGDTLEKIAAEKAGIIKKGTKLIIESQKEEVEEVFRKAAGEHEIEYCEIINPDEITKEGYFGGIQSFSFRNYKELRMRMLGIHQYENAAAAILAAEAFMNNSGAGNPILKKSWVRDGIFQTVWDGRMQLISKEPFLMVDGAHNSNGVEALKESLMYLFPDEKFHFIMGVMADKDYEKMVEELIPLALDFTAVTVESERALQAERLAECIRKKGIHSAGSSDLAECLKKITCGENRGKTVAFGSLYFVGEIEAHFREVPPAAD